MHIRHLVLSFTASLAIAYANLAAAETAAEKIVRLEKEPPTLQSVRELSIILVDPKTDAAARESASLAIVKAVMNSKNRVPAPVELARGLQAEPAVRKVVRDTLTWFHKFELAAMPILLEQIDRDEQTFVNFSHVFPDEKRLLKAAQNADAEIRARARSQLWEATQNVALCLPLYMEEQNRPFPPELATEVEKVEKQIKELQERIDKLAGPAREKLEEELFEFRLQSEVLRKQCAFNLRQLGIAFHTHNMTTDHPHESAQTLVGIMLDQKRPTNMRIRAAGILQVLASADEKDRGQFLAAGLHKKVEAAIAGSEEELKTALQAAAVALNTPHDRVKQPVLGGEADHPGIPPGRPAGVEASPKWVEELLRKDENRQLFQPLAPKPVAPAPAGAFGLPRPGQGVPFVFGDGSIRFLDDRIDLSIYSKLSARELLEEFRELERQRLKQPR